MNILVVDDVAAVQVAITAALKAAGHTVSLAGSGSEALKCLQAERFDVVITDLWMPDGDGLRLIKELRAKEPLPASSRSPGEDRKCPLNWQARWPRSGGQSTSWSNPLMTGNYSLLWVGPRPKAQGLHRGRSPADGRG